MNINLPAFVVLPFFLFGLGGCPGGDGGTDAGGDPFAAAEADVLAQVATFDTVGFTKINVTAFETVHGASPDANVWVTNAHAASYRELDPTDTTSTRDAFAPGMIVVKEQTDSNGDPVGNLLVMSKFDVGYNADDNDWWWGLFTTQDEISGNKGVVGFCIDCHKNADLVRTDYMLGVPADNQP